MNGDDKSCILGVILTIITVSAAVDISVDFKMGFWQTVLFATSVGLFFQFISWALRTINRKKLCAVITADEPENSKCKIKVLLWNPSPIKGISGSDYGGYVLCFKTDDGAVIGKPKLNRIRTNDFTFGELPETEINKVKLIMGDLEPKAIIEFEFEIRKFEAVEKTPSGIKYCRPVVCSKHGLTSRRI